MRLGLEQSLRQEMRLTPQLILQMKLLQVSALDLEQLVRKELEENPALEESGDKPDTADALLPSELPMPTDGPDHGEAAQAESVPLGEGQAEVITLRPGEEYTVGELLPDDGYVPSSRLRSDSDDEESGVALAAGPGENLLEAMMPRLRSVLQEDDAGIAAFIIESLDEDGFLAMSEEELAVDRGVSVERVRAVLYVIQRLEPGGIACRGMRESLMVQLELAGLGPDSLERQLLAHHWDLLLKKQTARVAHLCGVTEDDVRTAICTIVRLEARPARRFAVGAPSYVAPDFSIEWRGDELVAVANDETTPRLRLSQRYIDMLRSPDGVSREQLAFARQKFNRALGFLRGIESRRHTLQKLLELIIDEQREFFTSGSGCLKPATLREAADRLHVHPSTVSRAIAGKYVETTFGIFPLKYFYKAGAGDMSRTSIQQRVQVIIDAEDKQNPLSDDEICNRLKLEQIEISRRTVAKYRGELGIPGCNDRKGF